ncbi:MAG: hypothetical protein KDB35_08260 [Acidimicrobiales bacterium]|nr:hypothetical protein [Acidimicrobiales bacterium]
MSDPLHILMVEDNEIDVRAMRRSLRKQALAHELHVARDGVEALEVVTTAGFALLLLAALVAALALVVAVRKGTTADAEHRPDDPWGGQTLEWSTTSPPPWNNFAEAPGLVLTASPLLDSAEEGA